MKTRKLLEAKASIEVFAKIKFENGGLALRGGRLVRQFNEALVDYQKLVEEVQSELATIPGATDKKEEEMNTEELKSYRDYLKARKEFLDKAEKKLNQAAQEEVAWDATGLSFTMADLGFVTVDGKEINKYGLDSFVILGLLTLGVVME